MNKEIEINVVLFYLIVILYFRLRSMFVVYYNTFGTFFFNI